MLYTYKSLCLLMARETCPDETITVQLHYKHVPPRKGRPQYLSAWSPKTTPYKVHFWSLTKYLHLRPALCCSCVCATFEFITFYSCLRIIRALASFLGCLLLFNQKKGGTLQMSPHTSIQLRKWLGKLLEVKLDVLKRSWFSVDFVTDGPELLIGD